jgi:class 3 adenylate cyclase
MEDIAAKDGTTLFLATFHAYQGMVSYHLCNYEDSINQFKSFKKYIESVAGQSDLIVGEFYRAMALLAAASQGKSLGFKDRSIIQYSIKFFKKISVTCPDNFKAMYLLLLAEQASNKKDFRRAESLYSQARNTAKEFKNTNYSALANERSGRFYLQNNLTDIAAKFIETSYQYYAEWGAFKKLSAFIEEFPQIDFSKLVNNTIDDDKLETFADSSSESLDLQSIFKASTTISGEIVFEKLLEKLLKIIIENAGAQRVFLIMTDNGQLKAEAYGSFEQPVELLKSKPLDSVEGLAHTLVQLVFHTGETIILNDAASDNRFAKDKYIQAVKPKSVLGLPIKQHGKILAILYLENSIASGAFTPARLELLNLLSGQMAISLENALLYDNLEQKVIERTQTIEQQKMELEAEKEKSDTLLLNILPFETAEELKRTGSYKPRKYDNVSIVFTDFEGFTTISEKLTTEELVDMIDYCYKGFDLITSKHNIEKIKTIGDAYMCVSGLPVSNSEHASNAVNAAIEMLEFIEEFNADRKAKNQPYCRIRIGIHTGPVAAGVVGSKKFAYDIWGDSVNVAARLESAAEGGKINISNSTYELIKDRYHCVHRGKINVKNKGEIDMYFVNKLPENANMTGTL